MCWILKSKVDQTNGYHLGSIPTGRKCLNINVKHKSRLSWTVERLDMAARSRDFLRTGIQSADSGASSQLISNERRLRKRPKSCGVGHHVMIRRNCWGLATSWPHRTPGLTCGSQWRRPEGKKHHGSLADLLGSYILNLSVHYQTLHCSSNGMGAITNYPTCLLGGLRVA